MRIRAFLLASGVTGASVAGGLAFAGVASAQSPSASPCARGQADYPIGPAGQQVDDTTPARRQPVRGRGCASPNARGLRGTFASSPRVVFTTDADANGLYTFSFVIPDDAEDGPHTLTTEGPGVVDGVTRFFVSGTLGDDAGDGGQGGGGQGRGGGGGGRGLPRTGNTSTAPLTAAGVGLVLIGGFAVTAARRRRTAQAIDS